ncbi:kinase-like protein [Auriculariales sp. MPI-PUGE-AT-0066]|nr:kinase-like protein [Auriculariales sp. MPI-PUGE-AT-0066]
MGFCNTFCFCCACDEPIDYDTAEVDLYHFELHRALGKGAFGKVRVVEHKRDRKLYALKYIDKNKCIAMKAVTNIVQERRLLEEIDHPFVVNMLYAFQDDENCFMVLDLMLGGDLRYHARRLNSDEASIRIYMAELSSAISFLHRKNIIHRDIKPENVLLDEQGHAHLTDFNVACHVTPGRGLTSVAGTVYYMAPEMIQRKGYTWTVDWWSLGVMAYELLFGVRPFDGRKTAEVLKKIMNDPITVPDKTPQIISAQGKDFVLRLMERSLAKRIGCKVGDAGVAMIRSHPWFDGLDWTTVDGKTCQPPYVPDANKLNFDMTMELDEYMSPSQLLTHKKRKLQRDFEKMPNGKEHQQFEEEFTLWDFQKMTRRSYVTQPLHTVKPNTGMPAGTGTSTPAPSRPGTAQGMAPPTMFAGGSNANASSDHIVPPHGMAVRNRASDVGAAVEELHAMRIHQTPQVSQEHLPIAPEAARVRQ